MKLHSEFKMHKAPPTEILMNSSNTALAPKRVGTTSGVMSGNGSGYRFKLLTDVSHHGRSDPSFYSHKINHKSIQFFF